MELNQNELQIIKEIMAKNLKKHDQMKQIIEILRKCSAFQNFEDKFLRNIEYKGIQQFMKESCMEQYDKGEYIFHQGDISNNKYYFLLSGKIGVVKKFEEKDQRQMNSKSVKFGQNLMKTSAIDLQVKYPTSQDDIINKIKCYGQLQQTYDGMYDGIDQDILFNEVFERKNSCICMDNCIFLIFNRTIYQKINGMYNQELNKKLKLLQSNFSWIAEITSAQRKNDIFALFEKKILKKGNQIFQQGLIGDKVFFIMSGTIILERKVEISQKLVNDTSKQNVQIVIPLCELGANASIGDEILLKYNNQYIQSAYVVSKEMEYYEISQKDIYKQFPYDSVNEMINDLKNKEFHRQKFISKILSNQQACLIKSIDILKLAKQQLEFNNQINHSFHLSPKKLVNFYQNVQLNQSFSSINQNPTNISYDDQALIEYEYSKNHKQISNNSDIKQNQNENQIQKLEQIQNPPQKNINSEMIKIALRSIFKNKQPEPQNEIVICEKITSNDEKIQSNKSPVNRNKNDIKEFQLDFGNISKTQKKQNSLLQNHLFKRIIQNSGSNEKQNQIHDIKNIIQDRSSKLFSRENQYQITRNSQVNDASSLCKFSTSLSFYKKTMSDSNLRLKYKILKNYGGKFNDPEITQTESIVQQYNQSMIKTFVDSSYFGIQNVKYRAKTEQGQRIDKINKVKSISKININLPYSNK